MSRIATDQSCVPLSKPADREQDAMSDELDEGGDDDHWLEENTEFVLAHHDARCVEEAIYDAYAHGVDDESGARHVAAQLLEDRYIICRCLQLPD